MKNITQLFKSLVLAIALIAGVNYASAQDQEPVADKKISPVLECVEEDGNGGYIAHFGYFNRNDFEVEIPVGPNNRFTPNSFNSYLPSKFEAGRQYKVFSVPFDGSNLVWTLKSPNGQSATSTASDNPQQRCEDDGGGGDPGPEPCEEYSAYYVDNAQGANQGVLYGVEFTGGNAVFTELYELGYKAHLSYDPIAKKIYVNKNNGDFIEIFNADGSPTGTTIDISGAGLSGVCTNAFSRGYIYLGSGSQNRIVRVDALSGMVEPWASELPISGGDIAFRNGELFLATRSGKKLYTVLPDTNTETGRVELVGQTVKKVNGLALGPDNDNFVMTNSGKTKVYIVDPETGDSDDDEAYDAVVEIDENTFEEFPLFNGDLASGCASGGGEEPNDCANYVAYYTDHDGDNKSTIYGVEFVGGNAEFTEITTRDYEVHLAYNSDDGYIYTIDADDATYLERIDPVFGTGQIVALNPSGLVGVALGKVTALTYANGMLWIGSDERDAVYSASFVDPMTAEYDFVANAPVSGGDLAWKDGRLFLATRSGNRLIRIDAGNTTTEVGTVPGLVTGLAVSENNTFLSTNRNKTVVYELDDNGNPIGDGFMVTKDLEVLKNGDFSSGCADNGAGDPFCFVSEVVNPGAEINNIADNAGWKQYGPGELTAITDGGWDTTSSIEIQRSGSVNGVESHCDSGFHFELLSRAPQDNMYQVFSTDPGSEVHVVFYHKKRPGGSSEDTMQVEYGSDLNNLQLLGTHSVNADQGWKRVEMSFTATSAQTVVLLRGVSGSTGSVGNLIDDVYVGCDPEEAVDPCDPQGPPALVPHTGAYSDVIIDASRVSIYPVPAVTDLSIKVDNSGTQVEGTYFITGLNGRTSHKGTIQIQGGESDAITEDVSSLPNGVYFLVMEINGNRITKKFMKTSR